MPRKRYSKHYLEEWIADSQWPSLSNEIEQVQLLAVPDAHKAWLYFLLAYRTANHQSWRISTEHSEQLHTWDKLRAESHWHELNLISLELLKKFRQSQTTLYRLTNRILNAFAGWVECRWPLIMVDYIPSVEQMLEAQKLGKRYVSFLYPKWPLEKRVGERSVISFFLHDMIHADHFFADQSLYEGQVSFYQELSLHHQSLKETFDPKWRQDWNYLIADMNGHPTYLRQVMQHLLATRQAFKN